MDLTLDSIRDVTLYQPKRGYRFSVDALLLCDFVNLKRATRIADLGAGSGIIGILLAKRFVAASVDLFEIQDDLVKIARENAVLNGVDDRVRIWPCDLRELDSIKELFRCYDLVVSNPPFRRLNSGRLNVEEKAAIARHEISLRLSECVRAASRLLGMRGRFFLIYHPWRLTELFDVLKKEGIEPKRLRFVHSTVRSEAKMVLVEAVRGGREGLKVERPLPIYRPDGRYTEEMERIYHPT